MIEQHKTYCLIVIGKELPRIVTYRDFVKLLAKRRKTTAPVYIVGLPDQSFEAEAAGMKFAGTINLLKKSSPEILEARCKIKTSSPRGKKGRRRYEVKALIYTPHRMFVHSQSGWDLPSIFDVISTLHSETHSEDGVAISGLTVKTTKDSYRTRGQKVRCHHMIERHGMNPIIRPVDVKPSIVGYGVRGVFNPAATLFENQVLLLLRVAETCQPRGGHVRAPVYRFDDGGSHADIVEFKADDPNLKLSDSRGVVYKGRVFLSTASHIRIARSNDGLHFTVDDKPFMFPADETEEYGVEDARVTFIDGKYYINYTAVSQDSWATALAVTEDFESVQRKGLIFHPENKDAAIFPEKVRGKYVALHRPNNSGFGKASIWYAESPDMLHWGNHKCILRPSTAAWESIKIGAGPPPIRTPEGWLVIAHGKGDGGVYSLFCVLLDLEEPWRVIRRAKKPLLTPIEPYETEGFFGNVLFSNGAIEKDGKVFIYYGAADETTCLAITDIDGLLESF